jgi:hypothetical protein
LCLHRFRKRGAQAIPHGPNALIRRAIRLTSTAMTLLSIKYERNRLDERGIDGTPYPLPVSAGTQPLRGIGRLRRAARAMAWLEGTGEEFLAGDAFMPDAPQDHFIRETDVFSRGSRQTAA